MWYMINQCHDFILTFNSGIAKDVPSPARLLPTSVYFCPFLPRSTGIVVVLAIFILSVDSDSVSCVVNVTIMRIRVK